MNYSMYHKTGTETLSAAGIAEAALDARLLLEFITGCDHNTLYAHPEKEVSDEEGRRYKQLIAKRAEHIPLSHLTQTASFMGLEFGVSDKVLTPRQDSECLVEEAMRYVNDGSDILDLCTGSGCLLLSLMHYKNNCRGIGVDISEEALALARRNAAGLEEADALNGGSVSFIEGNMFDALEDDRKFDVIISNPPYIRSGEIETLMPEVRDHEPRIALDGGEDGLSFYRTIAKCAPRHLSRGGMIFLEIGYDQAEAVSHILAEAGFSDIQTVKDYAGNDRVIAAKHP